MKEQPILSVEHLSVSFRVSRRQQVTVVRDVSFDLMPGHILAIVGESGCGKSVTASAITGLLPHGQGKVSGGHIHYKGQDLTSLREKEYRKLRGREIAMIFQDPMTSLNPVQRISVQMSEMICKALHVSRPEALERAAKALGDVGIPNPENRLSAYPFELSGGMIQRVMIAMALAVHPSVLIADEPTTALDVTIQAQVLQLIQDLRDREGMSVMLITHDMGVVAETADDVMVMYAGEQVEYGVCRDIIGDPKHPYTSGLLRSLPRLDVDQDTLYSIEGTVPPPVELPGCRFAGRCESCFAPCQNVKPSLAVWDGRQVRCHLYGEVNHHE